MMNPPAPSALVAYDDAMRQLLAQLAVVPEQAVPLEEAEGLIAAGTRASQPLPPQDIARLDGYAVAALALVGASALSPVPIVPFPTGLCCGAPLSVGTDAVLTADLVEKRGPMALALGEVLPGEGVLRRGDWLSAGGWIAAPGARITGADLILAEAAGLASLECRVPRVAVLDALGRPGTSTARVLASLRQLGARPKLYEGVRLGEVAEAADLIVTIGGTGRGTGDRIAADIAAEGTLLAHGIGFSGAPSLATGRVAGRPVIALPGVPDAALAGFFAVVCPVLARLSGRAKPEPLTLPLRRKVSSAVGQAELLLLTREGDGWLPFAPGPLSPDLWRRAAGWRIVAAEDEGWPEGVPLGAYLLEGGLPS